MRVGAYILAGNYVGRSRPNATRSASMTHHDPSPSGETVPPLMTRNTDLLHQHATVLYPAMIH